MKIKKIINIFDINFNLSYNYLFIVIHKIYIILTKEKGNNLFYILAEN